MYNLSISDKNDVILEIFKSKGILLGSSTINKGIMSHMVGLIDEVRNLNFKDKFASSFGSYGWRGSLLIPSPLAFAERLFLFFVNYFSEKEGFF